MEMRFDSRGSLEWTDYWTHEQGHRAGAVWVSVKERQWHILLPDVPVTRLRRCVALPVTAKDQPEGWQWKLWLKMDINWFVHVPLCNFIGGPPPMPDPRSYYDCSLQMYGTFLPGLDDKKKVTHNFGHFVDEGLVPRLGWSRLIVARIGKNTNWAQWVMQHVN